jgi:RNA polymerase sigma-70 factor (ECF subfamily)
VTPQSRLEIQQLAARLADGDRSAIEPVFRAVWPTVRAFCARALRGAPEAEDVAQMALLKFFDQLEDLDRTRDAVAWVITIAAFECRTHVRWQQRRSQGQAASEPDDLSSDARSPEQNALERDLVACAREVLETLSEADVRTILTSLGEERGEQTKDAAFRKRLQRALGRLRDAWRVKYEPR